MTDTNCANCKHWIRRNTAYPALAGDYNPDYFLRHAESLVQMNFKARVRLEHGLCGRVQFVGDVASQRIETEPALVIDAEEYSAGLLTLGSFGCVLFEAKP